MLRRLYLVNDFKYPVRQQPHLYYFQPAYLAL